MFPEFLTIQSNPVVFQQLQQFQFQLRLLFVWTIQTFSKKSINLAKEIVILECSESHES